MNFSSELEHIEGFLTEFAQTLNIKLTDFLTHGVFATFKDLFCEVGITADFFDFLDSGFTGVSVSDQTGQSDKGMVVSDDSGQFRIMP